MITAANGKKSIDAVTVTVGGKTPTYVTPTRSCRLRRIDTDAGIRPSRAEPAADRDRQRSARRSDHRRTRALQGQPADVEAGAPAGRRRRVGHDQCRRAPGRQDERVAAAGELLVRPVARTAGRCRPTACSKRNRSTPRERISAHRACSSASTEFRSRAIVGWDASGNGNLAQMLQEPTLMGAYEGAGITVLARGVWIPNNSSDDLWVLNAAASGWLPYLSSSNADCTGSLTSVNGRDYGTSNFLCNPSRIDGVSVINSSQGGGAIFAHAWNHNLEVSNTRVHSNHGTLTGGITIGNGEFPDPFICDAAALDGTASVARQPAGHLQQCERERAARLRLQPQRQGAPQRGHEQRVDRRRAVFRYALGGGRRAASVRVPTATCSTTTGSAAT